MKKLATFGHTFVKSISSLTYYRDVLVAPFSFSFKYFWAFSLCLGLVMTILISTVFVPPLNKFVTRVQSRAASLYPANLVITLKDGKVSTNVTEPLHFPIPYELFTDVPPAVSDQKQLYLMTIDTKATPNDFDESQSLILVTNDKIIVRDEDARSRTYPVDPDTDATINQQLVTDTLNRFLPALKYLVPLAIVFLFLVLAVFLPLTRLISLIFFTLILHVAASLMHLSLGFRRLYQIGLHALTLPTLIQVGMTVFDIHIQMPFFNSMLYLLYGLVILATLRETKLPARK